MRKVVLLIILLFSLSAKAQEPLSAYAGMDVTSTFIDEYASVSVFLHFEHEITDRLATRTVFMLNAITIPIEYYNPNIFFGFGIEYDLYQNLYAFIDCYPYIKIHGIDHQVYGDYGYFAMGVNFGLGYEFMLGGPHSIVVEGSFGSDVRIYANLPEDRYSRLYPELSISYLYKLF